MTGEATQFRVVADRSALIIEARSSVGPISFGTTAVEGHLEAEMDGTTGELVGSPAARLTVRLDTLRSGNKVYDAELLHRVDARRHPTTSVALRNAVRIGLSDRFEVTGELAFHGITRVISGTVAVSTPSTGTLVVTGEHVFDMRDFDIVAPTVLMLRIYPDVRVRLQLEAEREAAPSLHLDSDRTRG